MPDLSKQYVVKYSPGDCNDISAGSVCNEKKSNSNFCYTMWVVRENNNLDFLSGKITVECHIVRTSEASQKREKMIAW